MSRNPENQKENVGLMFVLKVDDGTITLKLSWSSWLS